MSITLKGDFLIKTVSFFALIAVVLGACDPGPTQCSSDTQCKGDRICQFGSCVDRVGHAGTSAGTGDSGFGGMGGGNGGRGGTGGDDLPAEAILPIVFIPQSCNEWCWAAGVTMVATYFGISTSECTLASAYSEFAYDCCFGSACGFGECNHGAGTPTSIDRAFQYVGIHGYANSTTGNPPAIDELTAAKELAADKPVLLGFTGPFISHVALLTGYQTVGGVRQFHVMDPWYGEVDRPFTQLAAGGPDGNSRISDAWSQLHQ